VQPDRATPRINVTSSRAGQAPWDGNAPETENLPLRFLHFGPTQQPPTARVANNPHPVGNFRKIAVTLDSP
jgi:hypothetical protein